LKAFHLKAKVKSWPWLSFVKRFSAAVVLLSIEQIGYGMDEDKVVSAPPPRENNFNHER